MHSIQQFLDEGIKNLFKAREKLSEDDARGCAQQLTLAGMHRIHESIKYFCLLDFTISEDFFSDDNKLPSHGFLHNIYKVLNRP